jgi:hypothetical protein
MPSTPARRPLPLALRVFVLCLCAVTACQPFEDASRYSFEGDPYGDTSGFTSGTTSGTGDDTSDATSSSGADTSGATSSDVLDFDIPNIDIPDFETPDTIDLDLPDIPTVDPIEAPRGCTLTTTNNPTLYKLDCQHSDDSPNTMTVYVPTQLLSTPELPSRPVVVMFPSTSSQAVIGIEDVMHTIAHSLATQANVITVIAPYGPPAGESAASFVNRYGFMHEAARATRWVYRNIDALRGDPNHISLAGYKIGGSVALLLSMTDRWFNEVASVASDGADIGAPPIRGVVAVAPLLSFATKRPESFPIEPLSAFDLPAGVTTAIWATLDSILNITRESDLPPTLLIAPGGSGPSVASYLGAQAYLFAASARAHGLPVTLLQPTLNASYSGAGSATQRCFLFMNTEQLITASHSALTYERSSGDMIYFQQDRACTSNSSPVTAPQHPFAGVARAFITASDPAYVFVPEAHGLHFSHNTMDWRVATGGRFNAGGAQWLEGNAEPHDGWQRLAPHPFGVLHASVPTPANVPRLHVIAGRVAVNGDDAFTSADGNTTLPHPLPVLQHRLVPAPEEDFITFNIQFPSGVIPIHAANLRLKLLLANAEVGGSTSRITVEAQTLQSGFTTLISARDLTGQVNAIHEVEVTGVPVLHGQAVTLKIKRAASSGPLPSVVGVEVITTLNIIEDTLPWP